MIQNNGLDIVVLCLEDFDAIVKEAAAWALGYIARHNKTLAQATVDAGMYTNILINFILDNYTQIVLFIGAVPLLVLCLQEPELYVKQISASALCDISKHDKDLAQVVVDAGAVPFLAKALSNPDSKLKVQ